MNSSNHLSDPNSDDGMILLITGLLFCYLAPSLVSQTLALDGLVYANIAQLLNLGHGTWSALPYYETQAATFHDQPPLGIYLQGLWVGVFGTDFWVEKLFAALIIMLSILMLRHLQRQIDPQSNSWLALLLLAAMPISTYTLKNNFLEGILTLTTMTATWAAWRAWSQLPYAVLLGVLTFIGILIKGPVGLFPLGALPLALWWYHNGFSRAFQVGLIGALTLISCTSILIVLQPQVLEYATAYWQSQLLASIQGLRSIDHGRVYIVAQLASNLAIAGIVLACLTRQWRLSRQSKFWLIVGLCAAIPLLISARQYRHYLMPALPYFALALAGMAASVRLPVWFIRHSRTLSLASVAVVCAIVAVNWGATGDDAEELRDAEVIANTTGANETVYFCLQTPAYKERAYLQRHHQRFTTQLHSDAPSIEANAWLLCAERPPQLHAPHWQPVQTLHSDLRLWQYKPAP